MKPYFLPIFTAFITTHKMLRNILLILSLFIYQVTLKSQTQLNTDFKTYSFDVFSTKNINRLDIRAKHAQINLLNWDKDSISVETSIEVLCDKPNLSKEMLKEIKIKVLGYGKSTLLVKTDFVKGFNRTIPYKIKYNIFYPRKLALRIENKHGNVHIGDVNGGIFADLSFCNINIRSLKERNDSINNNINLLHCDGNINYLGSAIFQVENSTINIISAKNLEVSSSYSILDIKKVEFYNGSSKIDNIKIGESDNVSISSENCLIKIGSFKETAFFECKKGTLSILNTENNFKELIVNNQETSTKIHLNSECSYYINGEVINGNFHHPKTNNIQIIKELDKTSISGEVGNTQDSKTKVIIFNRDENIEFN